MNRKTLNNHNRNLLALVSRSIQDDLGWVTVSEACWPLTVNADRELFEVRDDAKMMRMTQEGKIVFKWMQL